jgi:hypothetical protein
MVKGEKIMPVPGGEITTSEILVPKVEEVVEVSTTEDDYNEDVAAYEAAVAEASEKAKNDLPELS